jgi:hypothetical protein
MAMSQEKIVAQLERELASVSDPALRAKVEGLLVEPTLLRCSWDYGAQGETFSCWKVAESADQPVGVFHCENGFGPECPWGLMWLNETLPSMGPDSGWFPTFCEAAADILDIPAASLKIS